MTTFDSWPTWTYVDSNGDRMNSLSYRKTGLIFEHLEWPILSHYEYRSMEVWCLGNRRHNFLAKDIEEWDPATYFYDWFGPAKNNTHSFIQMQSSSGQATSAWIHTTNETNSQITLWVFFRGLFLFTNSGSHLRSLAT